MAKKSNKLSKEELTNVQETQKQLNNIVYNIGMSTVAIFNLLKNQGIIQQNWSDLEKDLTEKYGNVSVNVNDGSLTPNKEEE
jgi:diketogulonate reductase-like aldo/keto reductase